jgi:hypothetical protein
MTTSFTKSLLPGAIDVNTGKKIDKCAQVLLKMCKSEQKCAWHSFSLQFDTGPNLH